MITRDLLVIPFGMNLTDTSTAREPVEVIAFEYSLNTCIRNLDAVIALQIPHDPDRTQVVFAAKMNDLLYNFWRGLPGVTMGD